MLNKYVVIFLAFYPYLISMDTERNLVIKRRCNSSTSNSKEQEESFSERRAASDRTYEKSKKGCRFYPSVKMFKNINCPSDDEDEYKSTKVKSPFAFLFSKSPDELSYPDLDTKKQLKKEAEERKHFNELCFNIFHFDLYGRTEAIERSERLLLILEETHLDNMKKYRYILNMQKQFIGKLPIASTSMDPCNLAKIAHKSNDAVSFYFSTETKTSEMFDTIEILFFRSIQVLILRDSWEDKYTHQNIENIIESVKHYRGERIRSGIWPEHQSFGNVDEVRKLLSKNHKFIDS